MKKANMYHLDTCYNDFTVYNMRTCNICMQNEKYWSKNTIRGYFTCYIFVVT